MKPVTAVNTNGKGDLHDGGVSLFPNFNGVKNAQLYFGRASRIDARVNFYNFSLLEIILHEWRSWHNNANEFTFAEEQIRELSSNKPHRALGGTTKGTRIRKLETPHLAPIVRVYINVSIGGTPEYATRVAKGLPPMAADRNALVEQVAKLYRFLDNWLVAALAKLSFNDKYVCCLNEKLSPHIPAQQDTREVAAFIFDLNYCGLVGEFGFMVNGAGVAMATINISTLHGGTIVHSLVVGRNALENMVIAAFKIVTSDDIVLVNILGGLSKCDIIAAEILFARPRVPVGCLEDTNVGQVMEILKESRITLNIATWRLRRQVRILDVEPDLRALNVASYYLAKERSILNPSCYHHIVKVSLRQAIAILIFHLEDKVYFN